MFLLSFFVLGTIVPLALVTIGSIGARATNAASAGSAETSVGQWIFLWVIWPTWIFMLDAEHAGTIVFMLLLAAPLNGLWYAAIASGFWYTSALLKRLAGIAVPHS